MVRAELVAVGIGVAFIFGVISLIYIYTVCGMAVGRHAEQSRQAGIPSFFVYSFIFTYQHDLPSCGGIRIVIFISSFFHFLCACFSVIGPTSWP